MLMLVGEHYLELDSIYTLGMALLSSSVIAELDKRKELNEKKAALLSTPGLSRRPLHQSQNKAAATAAAELKQVNVMIM